jgi:hypothetical protein
MMLRHSRTPSQVTPASVSLSHVVTDTGQLPAYLSWARRPCVDGTGFDTWPSRVSTPLWPIRQRNCVSINRMGQQP